MVSKKAKKSRSKGVVKERKDHVLSSLEQLGGQVYDQLAKKEFPTVKMPSRSIANIIYDDKTRQYILGKRNVKRSARNVRHVRHFTQLLWTAMFADELTEQNKTSTLRDVFFFFSSRRRHTRSVSAFLLNRSSDLVWFALSLLRFRLPSRLPMMFILWMVAMMVVIIPSRTV